MWLFYIKKILTTYLYKKKLFFSKNPSFYSGTQVPLDFHHNKKLKQLQRKAEWVYETFYKPKWHKEKR